MNYCTINGWDIKGQVLPLHVPAVVDFISESTVFAQDQVFRCRAPDHSRPMSWDLLIPEVQPVSGLTGGKGSPRPPLHPLGQHQSSDPPKDAPLAEIQEGYVRPIPTAQTDTTRPEPKTGPQDVFFPLLFPVSLNPGLS